jgi:hypothetical protein
VRTLREVLAFRRSRVDGRTGSRDCQRWRAVTAPTGCLADIADLAHMDGCAVLDAVADFLARFVAYPSDHARYAHALWLAHTWRMDEWESAPRLAFMSPEKGSGKTRSLEVSEHLVPRGVRVSQATTGYILAKISEDPPPTLFYDEIDTVYGQKARGNEDLRQYLTRAIVVGRPPVEGAGATTGWQARITPPTAQ